MLSYGNGSYALSRFAEREREGVCVCVYGCLQARVSVCLCERGGVCV